jgi:imidazolonepropionase-like amidohydrolase
MMRVLFLPILIAATMFHPASAQDRIAIVNVTVIDGTDRPPRTNATVLVQGKKIAAITTAARKSPVDARIVDGTGKFLIPGLWNNDLHGPAYGDAKASFLSLVSYGVTTVRDMGAPPDDIVKLRAATASGTLVGPRLFIAGPLMEGPVPVQMSLIIDLYTEKQARDEVKSLTQQHVDYIEVDTTLTPDLYWAIADEAKRQGIPLVGHIPAKVSAWDVSKAGQKDVEHLGGRFLNVLVACSTDEEFFMRSLATIYDGALVALKQKQPIKEPQLGAEFDERLLNTFDESKAQRLYRLYAENGVAQTPTLFVLKTLWQDAKDRDHLNNRDLESGKRVFAKDLEVVGEMKRAGVPILAGTDGPYLQGGDALHSELNLLVDAGLTPLQALQAASRDAARAMGVLNEVGTIEVGKTADLVLLDADPLTNISNTRKINAVLLHGQLFTENELSTMRSR